MKLTDPDKLAKRIIQLGGGSKKFSGEIQKDIDAFGRVWSQDTERIGRLLRAHLAVEHFLTNYLQRLHPTLGSLDDARITFAQKIVLLGDSHEFLALLTPGLWRLNKIRNRMAHTLKADVTCDDRTAILSIDIYRALRDESSKSNGKKSDDPLDIVEHFAGFTCSALQGATSSLKELFAQAAQEFSDENDTDTDLGTTNQ